MAAVRIISWPEYAEDAMQTPPKSRRLRRLQLLTMGLLIVIGFVNYLDRSTLSVANPLIRQDLGLSAGQMGILLAAFAWSYALTQVPLGPMIDRLGPRKLLGAGLVVWSAAQGLAGFVGGYGQFIWMRIMLGVGEAPQTPSATKIIQSWFNVRERGMPIGFFTASYNLGQTLAPPVITVLMLAFGWRVAFVVLGLAGFVLAAIWFVVYRDPEYHRLDEADRHYLVEGDQQVTEKRLGFAQWRRLLRYRTAWGMVLGFGCAGYLDNLFRTWLPGYLEVERHLSIATTGWATTIPFAFGVLGSLTGGFSADFLSRRVGLSPLNSARLPIVVGLTGMACFTALAAVSGGVVTAVICISMAMWLGHIGTGCAWILVTAAAPRNAVGSLGGLQNCAAYLGATAAPIVTGFSLEATGSFLVALMIGACFGLLAAVMYGVVVSRPIPPEEFNRD
jgi:sugar phosphate permease